MDLSPSPPPSTECMTTVGCTISRRTEPSRSRNASNSAWTVARMASRSASEGMWAAPAVGDPIVAAPESAAPEVASPGCAQLMRTKAASVATGKRFMVLGLSWAESYPGAERLNLARSTGCPQCTWSGNDRTGSLTCRLSPTIGHTDQPSRLVENLDCTLLEVAPGTETTVWDRSRGLCTWR